MLYPEQGLGDTIQFCRYAKLVSDRGARVILEAPQPLLRLLEGLSGDIELVEASNPLPGFDCHCSLMSLPLAFKTDLATIPADIPYLACKGDQVRFWDERLAKTSKLRVGLVWSGGLRPDQPETWAVNKRRNIPLAKLAPLRHPDVEFYSLQKGEPARSELTDCKGRNWDGPDIVDFTDELRDFSDTAALIENLDLVISVDTSTAHLAGALGKPVWLLNRYDIDWRWLLGRDDSPWYPSFRIYRQTAAGDWDDVIRRMKDDLARLQAG